MRIVRPRDQALDIERDHMARVCGMHQDIIIATLAVLGLVQRDEVNVFAVDALLVRVSF
jgi:hypothetical protein